MLHKCAVGGCPNRSDTIIHYILPEDPKRRSAWMKFMEDTKADGENVSASCRVCGDHFSEDSYFKLDLGYTTSKILSVDAVPTIHSVNRWCETVNSVQNEGTDDTCPITIAETVSLACVKEEPLEFDLNGSVTPQENLNSSLDDSVKCEEGELAISEHMDVSECDQGQDMKVKKIRKGRRLRTFNCLTCGQKFRGKGILMKHQREKHAKQKSERVAKEKIIVCAPPAEKIPEMHPSMQRSATLRAIDTDVISYKKHMCDQCGKRFAYECFLKAHLKVHEFGESVLPYACHLCPRRFGYKVALLAHLRRHMRTAETSCPICEKSFPSMSSLALHIKSSHAKETLFCKTCNSGFNRLNSYMKHMDAHNKVTSYYCKLCNIYLTHEDHPEHMLNHEKTSPTEGQEPVASSNVASSISKAKRGRKTHASKQENNFEEGSTLGIGSDSELVTARLEEAEVELAGEDEANVLDESAADPSELEAVESEAARIVPEEELAQDNHEEEKGEDDALTH